MKKLGSAVIGALVFGMGGMLVAQLVRPLSSNAVEASAVVPATAQPDTATGEQVPEVVAPEVVVLAATGSEPAPLAELTSTGGDGKETLDGKDYKDYKELLPVAEGPMTSTRALPGAIRASMVPFDRQGDGDEPLPPVVEPPDIVPTCP